MGRHCRQEVGEQREQPTLHSTNVPVEATNKPYEAGCLALQEVRDEGTVSSGQTHSEFMSSKEEEQEQSWLRSIVGERHSKH